MTTRTDEAVADRVASRYAARMTKPVHVKITGWGGKRNIPKKELTQFAKALKDPSLRGSGVGFSAFKQTVQINPRYLSKLEAVVKKQGLKMGNPKKMDSAISGIDGLN